MSKNTRQHGVTLIELMVTIGIFAILVGMAAPSFLQTVQRNRMVGHVNELVGGISKARAEAIRTNQLTTVCTSTDGNNCDDTNNWEAGWLIDTEVTEVRQPEEADLTIRATPDTSRIRFNARGFTADAPVTFTFCDGEDRRYGREPLFARAVIVLNTGRTLIAEDTDNNGIVNNHEGNDVACP